MKYLFLLSLFILGCSSQSEQPIIFHNLDKDFPVTDTLIGETMGNYELYRGESIVVKDSLLFVLERGSQDNFGRCFNLNTGEVITTLIKKGRANNEMLNIDDYIILGDSLQAISGNQPSRLNLYSIKDIVNGAISNPRSIYFPDTMRCFSFGLIDQTNILGFPYQIEESNDAKYLLFDGQKLHSIGKVNKELIESNMEIVDSDLRFNTVLFKKQGEKVVIASDVAIHFEILNLKDFKIEKERFYNKIQIEKMQNGDMISRTASSEYHIRQIGCNSDYIYALCFRRKEGIVPNYFVLKLDWNLNPITKYAIEYCTRGTTFSENCEYLYTLVGTPEVELLALKRYKL